MRPVFVRDGTGSGFYALVTIPGGVARVLRLGHVDGIENGADLLFAEELLGARDFDDGLAGSDGLLYDLGSLSVADVGIERRGEGDGALRVEVAAVFIGGDAGDAAVVELAQHV